MQEQPIVLKRDMLGRVQATAERRLEVVAEFRRSGLSGARFAKLSGMRYSTLMAWVKRQGGASPPVRKKAQRTGPLLMEAVVDCGAQRAAGTLVINLGGGVRMELGEAGQVVLAAQLIHALQKPC